MLWYVSIDDVEEAGPAGCFLQERVLATAEEREYVRRYIFPEDRKRSLLSLLLQHAVVRAAAGGAAYAIRRSREVRVCRERADGGLTCMRYVMS